MIVVQTASAPWQPAPLGAFTANRDEQSFKMPASPDFAPSDEGSDASSASVALPPVLQFMAEPIAIERAGQKLEPERAQLDRAGAPDRLAAAFCDEASASDDVASLFPESAQSSPSAGCDSGAAPKASQAPGGSDFSRCAFDAALPRGLSLDSGTQREGAMTPHAAPADLEANIASRGRTQDPLSAALAIESKPDRQLGHDDASGPTFSIPPDPGPLSDARANGRPPPIIGATPDSTEPSHRTGVTIKDATGRLAAIRQAATDIARVVHLAPRRIELHLDPACLGKVAVDLVVGETDLVTAIVTAGSSEAVGFMQQVADSVRDAMPASAGIRFEFREGFADGKNEREDAERYLLSIEEVSDLPIIASPVRSGLADSRLDLRV